MMYEHDTIELSMSEGWSHDILEVHNRSKLARKIVENLKVHFFTVTVVFTEDSSAVA